MTTVEFILVVWNIALTIAFCGGAVVNWIKLLQVDARLVDIAEKLDEVVLDSRLRKARKKRIEPGGPGTQFHNTQVTGGIAGRDIGSINQGGKQDAG